MIGFDHECEGSMYLQTAQGKLLPNPNRFQIHCWEYSQRFIQDTSRKATYTWFMRFGNDWFTDPKDKHLSFTVTITHCPFCGVDLAEEYRRHFLQEIHKAITSWVYFNAARKQDLYDKGEYIRIQPIQESKTYKD